MKKLYIEAYACSEHGSGPDYLTLEVTQVFVDYVKHLQTLCLTYKINEAHVNPAASHTWGPGDAADDLRLQLDELVVTQTSFWLTAVPKHSDYHVETRAQAVSDLVSGFECPAEGLWVMGDDPSVLVELLAQEG